MRKVLIAATALLSLLFVVPAFATEGSQTPQGADLDFGQMKASHLNKLDQRINSLQEEKKCVQAADNRDKLTACIEKQRAEARKSRDELRRGRDMRGQDSIAPPPVK